MVIAGWCFCRIWDLFLSRLAVNSFPLSCSWCFSRWDDSWGDVWQDVYCHQPSKIFRLQRGWWSASGLRHWPPSCKGPPGSEKLGSAMWVKLYFLKPRTTPRLRRQCQRFSLAWTGWGLNYLLVVSYADYRHFWWLKLPLTNPNNNCFF